MKIEIEHEGSGLGTTGGAGRLIVRHALAKGRRESIRHAKAPPEGPGGAFQQDRLSLRSAGGAAAPKGSCAARTVVGQPFGADAVNAAMAPVQQGVVEALGLGFLATVA